MVRARPIAEVNAADEKRYQYSVSGSSPVASRWSECAHSGAAVTIPEATGRLNERSAATSHFTSTGAVSSVMSRVHRMTDVGVGSPDATPSTNGSLVRGDCGVPTTAAVVEVAASVGSSGGAVSRRLPLPDASVVVALSAHDTTTAPVPRPSAVRKARRSMGLCMGGTVSGRISYVT